MNDGYFVGGGSSDISDGYLDIGVQDIDNGFTGVISPDWDV